MAGERCLPRWINRAHLILAQRAQRQPGEGDLFQSDAASLLQGQQERRHYFGRVVAGVSNEKNHDLRICEVKILAPRSNLQVTWKGRRAARHISFQAFLRETCSGSIAKRGETATEPRLWLSLRRSLCFSVIFAKEKVVSDLGREGVSEAEGLDRGGSRRCPLHSHHPKPPEWRGADCMHPLCRSPHKPDSGLTISTGISPHSRPALPPHSPGQHLWGGGEFPPEWGGKGSRNCPFAEGSAPLSLLC